MKFDEDPVRVGAAALPRILVVEDEADLALLLTYNLEAEGYSAESVERGDEAELRLVETPPDLVNPRVDAARRVRPRNLPATARAGSDANAARDPMSTARGEEIRARARAFGGRRRFTPLVKPFSVPESDGTRTRAAAAQPARTGIADRLDRRRPRPRPRNPTGAPRLALTSISDTDGISSARISARDGLAWRERRSCTIGVWGQSV